MRVHIPNPLAKPDPSAVSASAPEAVPFKARFHQIWDPVMPKRDVIVPSETPWHYVTPCWTDSYCLFDTIGRKALESPIAQWALFPGRKLAEDLEKHRERIQQTFALMPAGYYIVTSREAADILGLGSEAFSFGERHCLYTPHILNLLAEPNDRSRKLSLWRDILKLGTQGGWPFKEHQLHYFEDQEAPLTVPTQFPGAR